MVRRRERKINLRRCKELSLTAQIDLDRLHTRVQLSPIFKASISKEYSRLGDISPFTEGFQLAPLSCGDQLESGFGHLAVPTLDLGNLHLCEDSGHF